MSIRYSRFYCVGVHSNRPVEMQLLLSCLYKGYVGGRLVRENNCVAH